MSKFNNFSYKLFSVMMVLFCYTCFSRAIADPSPYSYNMYPIKELCPEGYYLSRCADTVIGTNWLKGIVGSNNRHNYFSYGSSASDTTNITNLRKFFTGIEPIYYTQQNSNQTETALPSEYAQDRNQILDTFCTNNSTLVDIECKKCPNNAKVPASTVKTNGNSTSVVQDSWQIYTIANCYMEEFSDHTGTYIYVQNATAASNNSAKKCYYSADVEGSNLVSE